MRIRFIWFRKVDCIHFNTYDAERVQSSVKELTPDQIKSLCEVKVNYVVCMVSIHKMCYYVFTKQNVWQT